MGVNAAPGSDEFDTSRVSHLIIALSPCDVTCSVLGSYWILTHFLCGNRITQPLSRCKDTWPTGFDCILLENNASTK